MISKRDTIRFLERLGFMFFEPEVFTKEEHMVTFGDLCWPWSHGRKDKKGYGAIKVAKKSWRVHVLAFTIFHGEVPAGMTVDHTCHTRDCCNPKHLRLLTRAENGAAKNKRKRRCSTT